MYDNSSARTRVLLRHALGAAAFISLASALVEPAFSQGFEPESVVKKISGLSEKLELTTNTSRILTLGKNIPRVQVNNPELVKVTPLSATDIQISAKKAGVTQVNLWDEDGQIHSIDVMIYGDARELSSALQTQFPNSAIKVYRYSDSLVLKGFVDQPENVTPIMRLAEDYAPKIINNMVVGGAQQVLLKVKVMEISRTQLRRVGVDWGYVSNGGGFAIQGVSDLIRGTSVGNITTTGGDTLRFGIVNGNDAFFGVLDLLNQKNVARILAEPSIVATSGRAARFSSGGEVPILIPQSLGTTSIEFKEFGTIVDFVPIVLGNGKIHLEVLPEVSTLDPALGIDLDGIRVPGFRQRRAHTAVEMNAGQTFLLAGLVEERTDNQNKGLPWVSDLPGIGVPFRKTTGQTDEIETLIMVTPEFVDPLDPHQVPCEGPGMFTTTPTACQLHCGGHVEVPTYANPRGGLLSCGVDPCGPCANRGGQCGCSSCGCGPQGGYESGHAGPMITEGVQMPGGVGYDDGGTFISDQPMPVDSHMMPGQGPTPATPEDLSLPMDSTLPAPTGAAPGSGASHFSPQRQPVYTRNASKPYNPQSAGSHTQAPSGQTGLIGPVGYDQ